MSKQNDHRYYVTRGNISHSLEIPPIDELCLILKEKFEGLAKRNDYLEEQVNNMKSGIFEKDTLKELKEEYDKMKENYYRGFPISEKENKKINEWIEKHEIKCCGGHSVSGGKYTYCFCPTGLGTIGKIICNNCKEEFYFQNI